MIQKIAKWKPRIARGDYPICYLCGKPITRIKDLSQDHIVCKSKGGLTVPENLLPSHSRCNNLKGDMSIVEWFDKINEQKIRSD